MGVIGGWWGRRTRWQQFLVLAIFVGLIYLAYVQFRGPGGGSASVFVVSSAGEGEELVFEDGRDPAWSPDGSSLAITVDGDNGDEINTVDVSGSEGSPVADGSEAAWSPDGATLAFAAEDDQGNTGIYVVAVDGGEPSFVTEGNHPSWSPDGTTLAFDVADADGVIGVNLIELETSTVTFVTEGEEPAWTPGGDSLAFVR